MSTFSLHSHRYPFAFFTALLRHSDQKISMKCYLILRKLHRTHLQPFRHFTYVTAHSPTLPSLYLRHSSFSNLSVASPTSQLIIQPFFRFSYVTGSSLTSPGEPPMMVEASCICECNVTSVLYV